MSLPGAAEHGDTTESCLKSALLPGLVLLLRLTAAPSAARPRSALLSSSAITSKGFDLLVREQREKEVKLKTRRKASPKILRRGNVGAKCPRAGSSASREGREARDARERPYEDGGASAAPLAHLQPGSRQPFRTVPLPPLRSPHAAAGRSAHARGGVSGGLSPPGAAAILVLGSERGGNP